MKIGILSETHGHSSRTVAALQILQDNLVRAVIHCGDIGSEGVVTELVAFVEKSDIPVYAVLGNVDYPDEEYRSWSTKGRFEVLGRVGEVVLDARRILVIHGDDTRMLDLAIQSGEYQYVFTGHTHECSDETIGSTRVINPGAVYRASKPTVAVLDMADGALEYIALGR